MIVNAFTSMPASDLHISWLIPIHRCIWHDLMPYHPTLSLTIKHCSLKLPIHAIHHHTSWLKPFHHCLWPSHCSLKLSIHAIHHHTSWPKPFYHCLWPLDPATWNLHPHPWPSRFTTPNYPTLPQPSKSDPDHPIMHLTFRSQPVPMNSTVCLERPLISKVTSSW